MCLDLLSEVKCGLLYVVRTFVADFEDEILHDDDDDGVNDRYDHDARERLHKMSRSITKMLSGMHDYFLPSRFYSTRYPYLGYKSAMFQIALDRADLQKQIRQGLEDLDTMARDTADRENRALIRSMVYQIHANIDKLLQCERIWNTSGYTVNGEVLHMCHHPSLFWSVLGVDFAVCRFCGCFLRICCIPDCLDRPIECRHHS